ncbi:MAG: hypothetical protein QW818_02435 [Candidatus Aenigmatarchaeota archaeon]
MMIKVELESGSFIEFKSPNVLEAIDIWQEIGTEQTKDTGFKATKIALEKLKSLVVGVCFKKSDGTELKSYDELLEDIESINLCIEAATKLLDAINPDKKK